MLAQHGGQHPVLFPADFVFKDRVLGLSPISEIHAMQDSFDAMKRHDIDVAD